MASLTPEIKTLLQEIADIKGYKSIEESHEDTNSNDHVEKMNIDKDCNGANWTPANIITLMIWITMAYYQLKTLEVAIEYNRNIVRNNVILGFILSTASGTISAATFGSESVALNYKLSILFTVMSFIISIYTSFIKIFQIQENLEKYITIKQEWIVFSTYIISELHMPITLRYDALKIIKKNKDKYLQLLKNDLEISWRIRNITKKRIVQKEEKRISNKWIFQKGNDLPTILMNSLHKLNLEYNYLIMNKKENVNEALFNKNDENQLVNSSLEHINEEINKQLVKTYKLQLDLSTCNEVIKHSSKIKTSSKPDVKDSGTDPIPYSLPPKPPIIVKSINEKTIVKEEQEDIEEQKEDIEEQEETDEDEDEEESIAVAMNERE